MPCATCRSSPRRQGASGFLNAAPDADGILRRVPLVAQLGGRIYPSLAFAAVSAVTGARSVALHVSTVNDAELLVDDTRIPLDARSSLLLRYRGEKRTFRYVSAADVMSHRTPSRCDSRQDRLRRHQRPRHPRGRRDASRHVVCRCRSAGDRRRQPPAAGLHLAIGGTRVAEVGAVLAVGFGVAVLFATAGIVAGLLGGAFGAAALWVACVWLLSSDGVFVSPLFGIVGVAAELRS